MKFDVILLVSSLGATTFSTTTFSTFASALILFAMIGEISRKRNDGAQIQYFHFSSIQVWKEYRLLHPKGRLTHALTGSTFLAAVFGMVFLGLLFGVLPKYSVPSR